MTEGAPADATATPEASLSSESSDAPPASDPPRSLTSDRGGRAFRSDVQGLRTIAVVLVVLFHSGLRPRGGFLGVDVFFVISGFVIGRLLLAEQAASGRLALGRFYARRIRRLVPALAAMLAFVAVASLAVVNPMGPLRSTVRDTGIGAALYVANFAILKFQDVGYFDPSAAHNPLLHTWTLGVEEQFYLVFPVFLLGLAWLARRRGDRARRRLITAGIALAAFVSFLVGAWATGSLASIAGSDPLHGRLAFYASPTRAWEFLAGVLVALGEPWVTRVARRQGRVAMSGVLVGLGLVMILGAAWCVNGTDSTPGFSTLVPVVGAALVILAGAGGSAVSDRVLAARPMVWLGDRSYGWYLWHWPFIVFAQLSFPLLPAWAVLLVAVLALVPTELSYRFLERPIRHNTKWLEWRRALGTVVATCICALVLFSALVWLPSGGGSRYSPLRSALVNQVRPPNMCYLAGPAGVPNSKYACIWRVPKPKGKLVVIGDSQAWALDDAFARVALRHQYDVNLVFRPSCPFADVDRMVADPRVHQACLDFVADRTRNIVAGHPSLVVIASDQNTYIRADTVPWRDPVSGRVVHDAKGRAAVWQVGLERTLATFADNNIPTLVVATPPHLEPFELDLCPPWRVWTDAVGCARTLPRVEVDSQRRLGVAATAAAVRAVPGSHLVDFTADLCTAVRCSTYRDGQWIYRDQTHVSPLGTRRLDARAERSMLEALASVRP